MFREKKQLIALAMIIVLAAAMAAIFFVNRDRAEEKAGEYEAASQRLKEQQKARDEAYIEQAAKEKAAAEDINLTAMVNLPGVVFYGRKINETDMGGYLPLIVETLIDQNVLDTVVNVVDLNDPHETVLQKTYLPVVFFESDCGLTGDVEAFLASQKELIAGRDRYIVLGVPNGTREEMQALEAAMAAEYGDKYINLREYLSTDGMASLGLTVYPEDEAAMAEGRVPPGLLMEDGVTLNATGYKLAAFLTYDRMTELGYFDEVVKTVQKYDKETEDAGLD